MSVAAFPWLDLPHDQTQGRAPYFRVWQDCLDGCKGKVFIVYFGLSSSPTGDAHPSMGFVFANVELPLAVQVREEIYTAFNTIYTVLVEFRKP